MADNFVDWWRISRSNWHQCTRSQNAGAIYTYNYSTLTVWDARISYKGELIGMQLGVNNFLIYGRHRRVSRKNDLFRFGFVHFCVASDKPQ